FRVRFCYFLTTATAKSLSFSPGLPFRPAIRGIPFPYTLCTPIFTQGHPMSPNVTQESAEGRSGCDASVAPPPSAVVGRGSQILELANCHLPIAFCQRT